MAVTTLVSVAQPATVQLRLIIDFIATLVIGCLPVATLVTRYLPPVTSMRIVPCATMGGGSGFLQSGLPASV